jgi:hypothetical protein
MKIKRIKTEIFEFDYGKEIKRLHDCFEGKQLGRQLNILKAAFEDKNLDVAAELISDLPYCDKEECWEVEFVGSWAGILGLTSDFMINSYLVDWNTEYEY